MQTLRGNNSRILTIKNVKFSEYYFYMSVNIWGDFQICISVPLNQGKMIFWFNYEKNNLKDIANYPCVLYLKLLWYRRNKMLWDRFNQQNHKNKILEIFLITRNQSRPFLTTIKSMQKLINADGTKVSL